MTALHALLLAAQLGGAAVPVAEYDIPWFQANPAALREMLTRCHADHRLAQTPECQNAEAAATRRLGQPLPPVAKPAKPPPAKGKDRAA
ncbi:EexN family lipoprotein (plasmid) [Skermanella rosea]|uniref:EexN family lipoprotein n=1 Tax=Skermanella rosea TaxID=1817965 RepID=UPI0019330A21|nr:EexN family lipoprotein [Skermanella rosea]UEM08126.1 EexN family lipoprotein [Skermanella rosea]